MFSIYTSEVWRDFPYCALLLIKFADVMAFVALLTDEDSLASYFLQVKKLHSWFEKSFLVFIVFKTKELVLDRRKHQPIHTPVVIDTEWCRSIVLDILAQC